MITRLARANRGIATIYQLLPPALWALNAVSIALIALIDIFDLAPLLLAALIIIHGLLALRIVTGQPA